MTRALPARYENGEHNNNSIVVAVANSNRVCHHALQSRFFSRLLCQRYSLSGDECIPCAPDTYNNGGMTWDSPDCFEARST